MASATWRPDNQCECGSTYFERSWDWSTTPEKTIWECTNCGKITKRIVRKHSIHRGSKNWYQHEFLSTLGKRASAVLPWHDRFHYDRLMEIFCGSKSIHSIDKWTIQYHFSNLVALQQVRSGKIKPRDHRSQREVRNQKQEHEELHHPLRIRNERAGRREVARTEQEQRLKRGS